jgi:hypothetical protein
VVTIKFDDIDRLLLAEVDVSMDRLYLNIYISYPVCYVKEEGRKRRLLYGVGRLAQAAKG